MARELVAVADEFEQLGYRLEGQTTSTATLARRFTPRIAYGAPLTIAALAFIVGIAGTTRSAATGGRIALFALIAAGVLALVVKTTERLTISAARDGKGSMVLVSGAATPALREWISIWGDDDRLLGASTDPEDQGHTG